MPQTRVEFAWDSGFSTPEGSRTWTDVSAYGDLGEGLSVTYGRADERSQADPNSVTLTLKNDDGRFTPGNTASPYYPNVKKGKPVRVSVLYAGVWYVRFTGYVNEWPVSWPDGSNITSSVTITASSRRARLGQKAPLTSAIRAAYLADNPEAYWPMDEDTDTTDRLGRQAFRDITNPILRGAREKESIGAFSTTAALAPVVRDGTQGPTDEESLVKFPSSSDPALLGTFAHYVGGGGLFSLPVASDVTIEAVARFNVSGAYNANIMWLASADQLQSIETWVTGDPTGDYLFFEILIRDPISFAVMDAPVGAVQTSVPLDGEIHHYALTLTSSNTVTLYFDGVSVASKTLTSPYVFSDPMTQVVFGYNNYNATSWIGHGAVYVGALSPTQIAAHAAAATAVHETPEERVVRVAGRIGVPTAEIDVETSLSTSLGPQPEAGRSATEVLEETAASTGGILYDSRDGHLALQARNHRYNEAAAFTLSTATQEVESDLNAILDDRYLVNTVEVTRLGVSDALPITFTDDTSIDDYGIYSQSISVAASSDEAADAAAQDRLFRYAEPAPRVNQVSVDIGDLSSSQRALVLAADIGTRFSVSGLPTQAPGSTMSLFLEGYTESISINGHTMTMNTTPADLYQNVFIWDDATRGKWDSGNVWAY